MSEQTVSMGAEEFIEVDRIGGDVHVEGWERQELRARGDVLQIGRRTDGVVVSCAGDLVLSVPKTARITLGSVGGDLELANLAGTIELDLIGGDATLRNLSGPVRLRGIIGGEVRLENVADLSMNSPKAGERFDSAERARRKVEQATQRAEAKLHGASDSVERARRKVEQANLRAELKLHGAEHRRVQVAGMWGQQDNAGSRTQTVAEPVEAPSDEERMAILRMLQDRKITSEQAEMLLTALEGKA